MTTVPGFRHPILTNETHARCMGLALVRAVESGDKKLFIERSYWFHLSLRQLVWLDDDPEHDELEDDTPAHDPRALAIEIRQHVYERMRVARGEPPMTCISEIVATPERRKNLVAKIAEAFLNAACKGA